MKIKGPFKDKAKVAAGATKVWYLSYFAPKMMPDGTSLLTKKGSSVLRRHRPYYETKSEAEADRPRIETQHGTTGSGTFLFDRAASADYENALSIVGEGVTLSAVARYWRLHHPLAEKKKIGALVTEFLASISLNLGEQRHWSDLKSRLKAFVDFGFGHRYPETVTRAEILGYLKALRNHDGSGAAPRTRRNHKTAVCNFFGWLVEAKVVAANPAAGIKRRMLPRDVPKELRFLELSYVQRYLRCAERYAPDLVAHEVIQLISGVRADDEMAKFRGEYVLPHTRQIVIPAAVAKTEKREVIDTVEDNFWQWWAVYGPKEGPLRPRNYEPRWKRLRVLASVADAAEADRFAKLPIKTLLALPGIREKLQAWPWNARRRSFCTYHIAMRQNADRTALILRHRGAASTLHNSYRGMGATQKDGEAFFAFVPEPVSSPILPTMNPKGVVKCQAERRLALIG